MGGRNGSPEPMTRDPLILGLETTRVIFAAWNTHRPRIGT